VLAWLAREQEESGAGVVVASHDPLPDPGWAHRRVLLARGAVTRDAPRGAGGRGASRPRTARAVGRAPAGEPDRGVRT
jgi:hypothetical protein